MTRHHIGKDFTGVSQNDHFSSYECVFVSCNFRNFTNEGAEIASIFVNCLFDEVDWYWCIGHSPKFINCTFKQCDLRGSFYDASFVCCRFEDCSTGDNELGGMTRWEGSEATECTLIRTKLPLCARDED
jgi:uncharacterized protein YjbI with pentapeptide repeats